MKKFTSNISPYILLLLPLFLALVVLLMNTQSDLVRHDVALQGSFFSVPRFNVCEVLSNFFH